MWGKQKEQMPHGVSKKRPAKTNSREKNKKKFFVAVAAEPVQGGRTHGEK